MKSEKQSTSSRTMKSDKGVAGLTILLSVVATIFIIGFLVMVFALIGSQLGSNASTATTNTVSNETGGFLNNSGYLVANAGQPGFRTFVVNTARNTTSGTLINAENYTVSQDGRVKNSTSYLWQAVTFNYTYTFNANNSATDAIADTTSSIAGVTSWFPIIITITVMVALILLTVIIIVAIRSSGILAGGQ